MTNTPSPRFQTANGYLTERIRQKYITEAIANNILPKDAHRMEPILSLSAPEDQSKPIQFWQLHSVLGQQPIVNIVARFYEKVFENEPWFTSVFEQVGGVNHHINTQASMWLDTMGGGPFYHGGEYRLSFHHTHNAMQLMNEQGAKRWVQLMVETLKLSSEDMKVDHRVRPAINTFLSYFLSKYAEEFKFKNLEVFGETNPPWKRKINFMTMTQDAIEALSESELKEALSSRGVDVSTYQTKSDLVNKALML